MPDFNSFLAELVLHFIF